MAVADRLYCLGCRQPGRGPIARQPGVQASGCWSAPQQRWLAPPGKHDDGAWDAASMPPRLAQKVKQFWASASDAS